MCSRMLHPTLWRTCRVLAHPARRRVLQAVCQQPGASVGEIQHVCRLPQSTTSLLLRQLQARGLLKATPDGRHVRYTPATDPSVGHAAAIQAAIRTALSQGRTDADIRTMLKGFTHARRVVIIRVLNRQPATPIELVRACRISPQAVYRHLDRLVASGFASEQDDGTFGMVPELPPLVRDLVSIACAD